MHKLSEDRRLPEEERTVTGEMFLWVTHMLTCAHLGEPDAQRALSLLHMAMDLHLPKGKLDGVPHLLTF